MKAKISAFLKAIGALFGVNEVLFLAGIGSLFHGLAGIWSIYGAFSVIGALLIVISVLGVLMGRKGGE